MELFAPQSREIFVEVRIPTVQLIKRLRRTVSKEQPVHKNPAVLVLYVQVGSYYAYFSILSYGLYTRPRTSDICLYKLYMPRNLYGKAHNISPDQ